MKYKVVAEGDLFSLELQVKELLEDGWECQGGAAFFFYPPQDLEDGNLLHNEHIQHTQAMIKKI